MFILQYEGEEYGDSDGGAVDKHNVKSYVRHLLNKPKTHVIRVGWRFRCPFCPTKPRTSMKSDFLQHVSRLACDSSSYCTRGKHTAVMQVLRDFDAA